MILQTPKKPALGPRPGSRLFSPRIWISVGFFLVCSFGEKGAGFFYRRQDERVRRKYGFYR